ncbi:MAG TPA: hypothetical protein VJP80_03640 [Candidatus Saccharimonadales bacterium]|nr:hypothetical protein [Candidatus Saccharimonadales bacterium]
MIERKTVLIIGAGASSECGLPVGAQLKGHIAQLLDIRFEHGFNQISGDNTICEALRVAVQQQNPSGRDINPCLYACWRIRDAMPQATSIDNFIDVHQGNNRIELCGKLAIVRSILEAEKGSHLYFDPYGERRAPQFGSLQSTWFNSFFQLLTENCKSAQLEQRFAGLTLIIFNYDRCVEHFLFYALQNYYGVSSDQSAALLNKLAVFHPYGSVGPLPWQKRNGAVDFGAEAGPSGVLALAQQIRTFTEGTDPGQSDIEHIRKRFFDSQIVLFLGFAYHRLNLQLLRTEGVVHSNPGQTKYFGTAVDISHSDCVEITQELQELGAVPNNHIHVRNDLTCARLFGEYWRSLSLARFA